MSAVTPVVEMRDFSVDVYKGASLIWTHIIFFDITVQRDVERMLQTTDVFISHGEVNGRFRSHGVLSVPVKINPLLENPRLPFLTDYIAGRLTGKAQMDQLSIGPGEEEELLHAEMEGYL